MKRPVVAHNGIGVTIMLKQSNPDGTYMLQSIPDADYTMEIHEAMEFAGDLLRASGDVLKERARAIAGVAKKNAKQSKPPKETP